MLTSISDRLSGINSNLSETVINGVRDTFHRTVVCVTSVGTQTFPNNPPPFEHESDQSVPMECSKREEKGFHGATLHASAPAMEKMPSQPVNSYFKGEHPSIHVSSQPSCNKLHSQAVEKATSGTTLCGKHNSFNLWLCPSPLA